MPKFTAAEIVAIKPGGSERGDHAPAIRHRRSGAKRIGFVSHFLPGPGHAGLPEQLAVGAVEAHDRAPIFLLKGLGDEDAIAPDDGSRIASVGQRRAPADVFVRAPMERKTSIRGAAGSFRSA